MNAQGRKFALTISAAAVSLCLAGCSSQGNPPPAGFAITATKNSNGLAIIVKGQKFTPGGQVKITYANIPNRSGTTDGGPSPAILGDGTFIYTETFNCTSHDPNDANALVLVTACDQNTVNCPLT